MYYSNTQEDELGFDAFIAPDGFDHTAQPVDIYTKFKEWYPIDSKAKYIYYYSDGNYPLTLTPTADEYYKYGYTRWNAATSQYIDVTEDMHLNSAARTIWGTTATFGDESGYTKRWVIVYRVSMAKFGLTFTIARATWYYLGQFINSVGLSPTSNFLTTLHCANINSLISLFDTYNNNNSLTGRCVVPETVSGVSGYFLTSSNITKVNLANTKNISIHSWQFPASSLGQNRLIELNIGASTSVPVPVTDQYWWGASNMEILSASNSNTAFKSFDNCDILYNKAGTEIMWVAVKTKRGLYLPDTLPQTQITNLKTNQFGLSAATTPYTFSSNIMQGYQLYIGTLITDLTNLYLSNKSFTTVEVGVGNTAFMVENNILYNTTKTELIKAGTNNTGSLVIDNAVTTIKSGAFLRCVGYTGGLTIPDTVTSIVANSFAGLSGLTGNLVIGNGVTSIVANSFAGVTNLAGSLTIPTTVTTIESGSISALKNLTGDLIFTGGQWNLSTYNQFGFANFTATSIKSIVDNDKLVNGTVGSPKYFYISKTTYDTLVALSGGQASIDLAASRYINVKTGIIQDGLKLWLDASNPSSYPGTGTTWFDLSGNGNNGTMVNGVVPLSNAMSFDGVNDYVVLTNAFPTITAELTASIWVKPSTQTNAYAELLGNHGLQTQNNLYNGFVIQQNNLVSNQYYGVFGNGTTFIITPTVNITPDVWSNITMVKTTTTFSLYVNGILSVSINNSTNILPCGSPMYVGRGYATPGTNSRYFKGLENDAAIYSRALAPSEVLQNFNSTRYKYGI